MKYRVAINGFGRIGRMVLRALTENNRENIEIVAINDVGELETNAHLFKYDSVHGRFRGDIQVGNSMLDVGLGPIRMISEPNPEKLPWKKVNIDLVLECTGRFANHKDASRHIQAGAKRVLVSALTENADQTVVFGVNHNQIKPEHEIISNASCTTNCFAPVAYVLNEAIGIQRGYMITVHAYTNDQRLVDSLHKDLRRTRAVGMSLIPSYTNAAQAINLILPELQGRFVSSAIRVPTVNVSVIDFKFVAQRQTTKEEINQAIIKAAEGKLKGILGAVKEPLVSIDFNHNPHSSSVDLAETHVIDGTFCRVLSWYDNEWGYSNRMWDVANHIAALSG